MEFKLSKEHEMLQKAVRDFAKKKIAPNVEEWDANHYLPIEEVIRPMGELGFFGATISEEYGDQWYSRDFIYRNVTPWRSRGGNQ